MNQPKDILWNVDPMHTTVGFTVRHLMITNVHGTFEAVSGLVHYDPARPEALTLDVEVSTATVHTRVPQRDAHLRSADFFDVERFPKIAFHGAGARLDGADLAIDGELTLHGVTRPLTLLVTERTGETLDRNGATRMGASAHGRLKRSDFGMMFNPVLETGGIAIADEIALRFDVSLVKAQ